MGVGVGVGVCVPTELDHIRCGAGSSRCPLGFHLTLVALGLAVCQEAGVPSSDLGNEQMLPVERVC